MDHEYEYIRIDDKSFLFQNIISIQPIKFLGARDRPMLEFGSEETSRSLI